MNAAPAYLFKKTSLPGVSIVDASSPDFRAAVSSLVDPAVMSSIEGVLPFSYILRNNSTKFIVVYSTRWTLTDTSGQVTSQDRTWWNLSTLHDGDAIAPGASRLVSPIFRLGVRNAGPTGQALMRHVQRTLNTFSSKARVETSLETVIFEDGHAIGTDATNASAQAQAYLDAEREVVDALVARISAVAGHADEKQLLSGMHSGPRSWKMSNPPLYEESLATFRESLTLTLVRQTQQSNAGDATGQLEQIQQNVASKRNLRIVRQ